MREYRKLHTDAVRATEKRSYWRNREKRLASSKEDYRKNREAYIIRSRLSQERNFVRRRSYMRYYLQRNKVRLRHFKAEARRKRVAIQNAATIGDTLAIRSVYARAAYLRKWFNVVVDHIHPLIKGGAHAASNLQIIYALENSLKGAKLNYQPSIIFT